ncbi:hypothetical protein CDD82_3216 [Ophiocordyceps australis]|uniref:Thioesterase domain-containing protein n=1 Tax=Ophiocordyceps australis TaxID=1399860 RepID=A0A2C5ZAN4_9HYPO|nr:hypothetical protein CDD82_3216 [Ophiocordyceps australis]
MIIRRQLGRGAWRLAQQQCRGRGRGRSYATAKPEPAAASAAESSSSSAAAANGGRAAKMAGLALFGAAMGIAGAAAAWKVVTAKGMGFYSDEESLTRFSPSDADDEARRIYQAIESHPLVAQLRSRPDLTESRPHLKMPASYRRQSLTANALAGPRRVPVPAIAWTQANGQSVALIVYAGPELCGHPGLLHGGFLATLLDEGLAWCCFAALPHGIGVTARLAIDYRKPAPAGSLLLLRGETVKVEGRKAWVKGRVELLDEEGEKKEPVVVAEAEALYVSPRQAALMPRLR